MNSHNTFDNPDQVKPKDFNSSNFKIEGNKLSFKKKLCFTNIIVKIQYSTYCRM